MVLGICMLPTYVIPLKIFNVDPLESPNVDPLESPNKTVLICLGFLVFISIMGQFVIPWIIEFLFPEKDE